MQPIETNSHREPHRDHHLSWAYDDEYVPAELTIFDPRGDPTTHWITVDQAYACSLEECV